MRCSRVLLAFLVAAIGLFLIHPAPAVATGTASIAGTVTGAGAGGQSVWVSVFEQLPDGTWQEYYDYDESSEHADGTYTVSNLAAGTYTLEFTPQGGNFLPVFYGNTTDVNSATPITISTAAVTGIDATLPVGGVVTGRVTNANTTGLGNVTVYLSSADQQNIWEGATAADGTYSIVGVPTGTYSISFNSPDNYIPLQNSMQVSVTAGQTTSNVDAVLAAGASISGTITDASNSPIADASASVTLDNGDGVSYSGGTTDAAGQYTITQLPAGSYTVTFDGGYDNVTNQQRNYVSQTRAGVVVPAGGSATGVDAQLATGGEITGTVSTSGGRLTDGGYVWVMDATTGAPIGSANVDSSGNYDVVALPTGDYVAQYQAYDPQYVTTFYGDTTDQSAASHIHVVAGQPTTGINVTLAIGGSVAGTITLGLGASTDARIAGQWIDATEVTTEYERSTSPDGLDGPYSIQGLMTGTYDVSFAHASGYTNIAQKTLHNVSVSEGQATSGQDVTLDVGSNISGVLQTSAGAPVSGVQVSAYTSDGSLATRSAFTGSDGSFTIPGLSSGSYLVDVEGGAYWYAGTVTLSASGSAAVGVGTQATGTVQLGTIQLPGGSTGGGGTGGGGTGGGGAGGNTGGGGTGGSTGGSGTVVPPALSVPMPTISGAPKSGKVVSALVQVPAGATATYTWLLTPKKKGHKPSKVKVVGHASSIKPKKSWKGGTLVFVIVVTEPGATPVTYTVAVKGKVR